MSKNQVTPTQANPNTSTRTIIIAIILVVALVAAAITAGIMFNKTVKPDAEIADSDNISPTDTIKDGTFEAWTIKKDDSSYPRLANKWWNAYTRKSTSTDKTTYFEEIISSSNTEYDSIDEFRTNGSAVYGIIDTETKDGVWDKVKKDVAKLNISLAANPGARPGSDDTNIYMIAANEATSVALLSNMFSVSSGSYVEVSMWINAANLKGSARVLIQANQSTSVTAEKLYVSEEITSTTYGEWKQVKFYLFNQSGSTEYFKVSLVLGDIYTKDGATGSGMLFVDDVKYTAVSSNEYRLNHGNEKYSKVFPATATTGGTAVEVLGYRGETSEAITPITSEAYLATNAAKGSDGKAYSPFLDADNHQIYTIANNGATDPVYLRLNKTFDLQKRNDYTPDCLHISFSLRMFAQSANTKANIVVESKNEEGKWEKVDSASVTVDSVTDITEATANCGWKLYHLYFKPSDYGTPDQVRISIYIGSQKGASSAEYAYNGTLYVTDVAYEEITAGAYDSSSTSSDSVVKKVAMTTDVYSGKVTNGSFSVMDKVYGQPSNWTPVFGGSNDIFRDGKGNTLKDATKTSWTAVNGSGVVANTNDASKYDDGVKNILKVSTTDTAFGYLSTSMSLSANKAYVISVLVKTEAGSKPYLYLVDTDAGETRESKVIASITDVANDKTIDGTKYFADYADEQIDGNGNNAWTRYYFVIVTGSKTRSVRLALMSGDILGNSTATNTVYYDSVMKEEIGGYTLEQKKDTDETKTVTYTANDGYTAYDKMTEENADLATNGLTNVKVVTPTEEEWKEMTKIEKKDDDSKEDDKTTPNVKVETNWGLFFSILSSIILVAALAVVIVIRIFRKRA